MTDSSQSFFDDTELMTAFLQEAREHLEILDQGLVRLEREPDNAELIRDIFRATHTLKGSSSAMGLTEMTELSHAMEDVLDAVREGLLTVDAEVADRLLFALDLLRDLERDVEEGRSDFTGHDDLAEMVTCLREIASRHKAPTPDAGSDASSEKQNGLAPLPENRVCILVNFADDCQMLDVRAFMVLQTLDKLGTVIESTPTRADIDAGVAEQRLIIVLETDLVEEEIRHALSTIAELAWARVARGAAAAGMSLHMPLRSERCETETVQQPSKPAAVTPAPEISTAPENLHVQQTVRVSVDTLDQIMNLVGELVLDRTRIGQLSEELRDVAIENEIMQELDAVAHHLGSIVGDLHERILETRMLLVRQLFNRFPRLVRDLCRSQNKEVDLRIDGETEKLDRSVIEKLVDPLTHIIRNALDHGIESPEERERLGKPRNGTLTLSARRSESHIVIEVGDDGHGINTDRLVEKALAAGTVTSEQVQAMSKQERLGLIFTAGLSTAERVSDISGRGVGMDVVKRNVESLGGTVTVESELGHGSTITLQIPLTLAIVRALIVRVGRVAMAIPLSFVEETLRVTAKDISTVHGRGLLSWRDQVVPLVQLSEAFPGCETSRSYASHAVVVRYGSHIVSLLVDNILGHQEIVVKSLGSYLGDLPGLAGATILGNGRVALIVDIGNLFEQDLLRSAALRGIVPTSMRSNKIDGSEPMIVESAFEGVMG